MAPIQTHCRPTHFASFRDLTQKTSVSTTTRCVRDIYRTTTHSACRPRRLAIGHRPSRSPARPAPPKRDQECPHPRRRNLVSQCAAPTFVRCPQATLPEGSERQWFTIQNRNGHV